MSDDRHRKPKHHTGGKIDLQKEKARLLHGVGAPLSSHFEIDDFQREAISLVSEGVDTLVVAPTGAGKTFIALQAIEATIGMNARSVYTTPLKALSNTKYSELKKTFEPRVKVGLLTGDRKIDGDASVVVATTEIYRNELYKDSAGYGLVVLDEVHYISDQQRGAVWEESIILTPTSSTLLMLSASISNAAEVAGWISEVRGRPCRIVIKRDRPVELRLGFLHPDIGVMPLSSESGRIFEPVEKYYEHIRIDGAGMRLSPRRRQEGHRQNARGGAGSRHAPQRGGHKRGKR
jgi:ATP-dependent RNA helicase HelY